MNALLAAPVFALLRVWERAARASSENHSASTCAAAVCAAGLERERLLLGTQTQTRCHVECRPLARPDWLRCWVAVGVPEAVTLAYLCLFYVTAPPSGEMTVQHSLRG